MADGDPRDERRWERGWEEHALAQRRRLARLPLIEKLRWLEEAQQVAERMRRDRRAKDGDPER